jgi:hypothetical protein
MIVRNKCGEFKIDNSSVLLEFLGVKKEAAGLYKVDEEIELMASVPFIKEQLTMNKVKRGMRGH